MYTVMSLHSVTAIFSVLRVLVLKQIAAGREDILDEFLYKLETRIRNCPE